MSKGLFRIAPIPTGSSSRGTTWQWTWCNYSCSREGIRGACSETAGSYSPDPPASRPCAWRSLKRSNTRNSWCCAATAGGWEGPWRRRRRCFELSSAPRFVPWRGFSLVKDPRFPRRHPSPRVCMFFPTLSTSLSRHLLSRCICLRPVRRPHEENVVLLSRPFSIITCFSRSIARTPLREGPDCFRKSHAAGPVGAPRRRRHERRKRGLDELLIDARGPLVGHGGELLSRGVQRSADGCRATRGNVQGWVRPRTQRDIPTGFNDHLLIFAICATHTEY